MKTGYKKSGENFIPGKRFISQNWRKCYRKFEKIQKKIDKLSIRDWGTIEKVQQKLEKGINFGNIRWNFEKKN